MNKRVPRCEGFSISLAEGWNDITATLEDADPPLTIADPVSGVGAIQFSPAIYKSGRLPRVSPNDLAELLDEFARKHKMGEAFDRSAHSGEVAIEGASFHAGGDFTRVWYVSDGKNLMLVTYVCDWDDREQEDSEREMAVRSVRFDL
jgi:hypothetical protein